MATFMRHFTVDEANALLPFVRSVFEKVQAVRDEMSAGEGDLDRVHRAAPGNGGDPHGTELVEHTRRIGSLLGEIEEKGIVVKDLETGLVDFPHIREEREVFLCWKKGERSITSWHEIDSGYKGRQPL